MKKYKYKLKPCKHGGFFIYSKQKFKWKLARGYLSGHFPIIEHAIDAIKLKHVNEKGNIKISISSKYTVIRDK